METIGASREGYGACIGAVVPKIDSTVRAKFKNREMTAIWVHCSMYVTVTSFSLRIVPIASKTAP